MPRRTSTGTCEYCGNTFSKQAISRHLKSCAGRPQPTTGAKTTLYHLMVEGRGAPEYWLHIEMPASAKLSKLDDFLRDIWVECCGHLSVFTIGGREYHNDVESAREFGEKTMNYPLSRVLSPGVKFDYEYDFGTTTELTLKVVEVYEGVDLWGETVKLLAQNDPPDIRCSVCGQPATELCAQCIWEGDGWLCEQHAEEHECGEDMLLPVVNSPRVGMCAYSG